MLFNRILLKLSGEALIGKEDHGIDPETVRDIAFQIKGIKELGVEIGIVIGGGNIYRGMRAEKQGIDRVTGDYMGMLATLMNALVLEDALKKTGIAARVQSALQVEKIAESYFNKKAIEDLEKGRVVVFACGTGNPFFTTDTAAALRALEIGADVLLKATKVDGVYDRDPEVHSDAVFFSEISYIDVLNKGLKVMDATAISLCMDNNLPVIVTNIKKKDNLKKAVLGEPVGTIVKGVDTP
ncbi:MAG TPA: UMP kinase [Syntrophorhabdaceae bacterium]|nr:UMP kinase [Syntrophorhabdaceae bacterium]